MLNWAIVGCGDISDLRIVPGLKGSTINRLAAVVSRDAEKAAAFARKHGAERSFDSFERMLEDPRIDVVYLGTPNALHAGQAMAACAAGKHVFCDKPMALTVADCEAMVRAARQAGLKLGVGFNNRYNPGHLEARRLLEEGVVGEVAFAGVQARLAGRRSSWRLEPELAGGGALMDLGVHAIDLFRFLLGREVLRVSAFADTATFGWPIDEVVTAVLELEGGIHGFLSLSQRSPYPRNGVEVQGSKGSIAALGRPVSLLRDPVPLSSHLELLVEGQEQRIDFPPADPFRPMLDAFGRAVLQDEEPGISGIDGLRAQEVAVAIQESARTGTAVRLR